MSSVPVELGHRWWCILLLGILQQAVHGLDNGLARTPPMGWMTWQRFRCITDCKTFPDDCISEQLIKRTALAMSQNGYKEAGYEYIVIDDCWSERERDPVTKKLVPDKIRFPSGFNHLSDYIHSLGLKFGLYQDFGTLTCAGYPGIIGYEELDAQSFADWGVDYVKLDGCYSETEEMDAGYPKFGALLNQTGRPMVYSCSWPVYQEYNGILPNFTLIMQHCNLWRNWGDIDDSWASVQSITSYFGKNQERIAKNAGPGHWNDPDMLLIGNFGLSAEQSRAQLAVWAILAAPLLMSNDLDRISPEMAAILLNHEVIAVNQDALGMQGRFQKSINDIEIWTRPLKSGNSGTHEHDFAVAFVSQRTDGQPYKIRVDLSTIGLTNAAGYKAQNLYDASEPSFIVTTDIAVIVNPSGCKFYKFYTI